MENKNAKIKLPFIKAKIDRVLEDETRSVKAYASVTIGNAVAIHCIKVMQSEKGLFVAMPSRSYIDDGARYYTQIAHPISKEAREVINNLVLKAYKK